MSKTHKKDAPRELERSGELCLAFANTTAARRDDRYGRSAVPAAPDFASYADLLAWSQRMGVVQADDAARLSHELEDRSADAAAVFQRALGLRIAIGQIFTAIAKGKPPPLEDLEILNSALAELPPREVAHEGDGFTLAFIGAAGALERAFWPISLSAAQLLISDDRKWVRQCADAQCTRLFVDRRSRRRKWCDTNTCGSRDRGKRLYRRGGRVRF